MRYIARGFALLGTVVVVLGCSDSLGSVGNSFDPVWITASWSGGAAGVPNDRTDREPAEWSGSLCPASSVTLLNWDGGFAGLNVQNHCTIPVTYYICATAGSLPQPNLGLDQCAQDPFDTPLLRFNIMPLNPGNLGDYVNATQDLSIQLFYCTDQTQLMTEPLRCFGV